MFFDDRGLQLSLNKHSLDGRAELTVAQIPIAPAKKGRARFFTTDYSYLIKPSNLSFNGFATEDLPDVLVNSPIQLILKAPPNTEDVQDKQKYIARWDADQSRWQLFASQPRGANLIAANIIETGEYIALAISKPLAIENLQITPNPFSPYRSVDSRAGLRIDFDLSSNAAPNPLVTIRIVNLEGNLVRILHDQTLFPRGHAVVYWDGRTDNGTYARNGRYLIHVAVEDPLGKEEELKTVVLIK
jgi:hypothetical protein